MTDDTRGEETGSLQSILQEVMSRGMTTLGMAAESGEALRATARELAEIVRTLIGQVVSQATAGGVRLTADPPPDRSAPPAAGEQATMIPMDAPSPARPRSAETPAKKAPAKKTPAKKTPAKKTPAKKTPAKKASATD